jgi:hypothetical protein
VRHVECLPMDPDDIRRWDANYRAAAARERQETARHPLTPEEAFDAAMALLVLDEELNGSPFERTDPVSQREDEQVWAAWAKLRARWPRGG